MIPINIMTQPDDFTCGPTSLHAVYDYYGEHLSLEEVINGVSYLEDGGTLAVFLGTDAIKRGYEAKIYTYNLDLFDPSWFKYNNKLLIKKLEEQKKYKTNVKFHSASNAYIEFLRKGGKLDFENLISNLFKKYFERKIPILAGLSSTYLYQCPREIVVEDKETVYDDVKGFPAGHFVVLCGYDEQKKHVVVADPYKENSFSGDNYYTVKVSRLINSILLGMATYDANMLVVEPKNGVI